MGHSSVSHSWDAPECPECDSHHFVDGNIGGDDDDYQCYACDVTFDEGDSA